MAEAGGGLEVSILMPCLNEAKTVGTCVDKAVKWLAAAGVSGEVIVADNGSTDGSQEIAARLGARVVPVAAKGYGAALLAGSLAAKGRFVIMGDSDDSYDFTKLEPYVEKLREGCDLVVGNRFRGGIKPGAMPTLNRYLGNPFLTTVGRVFFGSPVNDFYCGLRGFRREALLRMQMRATGMEFAIEMIVKATLLDMRITEVPTVLWPDGRGRPSHLHPWRDGWRTLRFLMIYSPRWLFWYPGIAFVVLGSLLALWVLPGPRVVSGVTFDIQTLLLGSMMALIGFQGMSFAVFAKVFALSEGLLPPDARVDRAFRYVSLEVGLAAGAVLLLTGLAGAGSYAWTRWQAPGATPVDPSASMRLIIPSMTMVVLGSQVILASFFVSILWIRRRLVP